MRGGKRVGAGAKPGNWNGRKRKLNQAIVEQSKIRWREFLDDDEINEMDMLEIIVVSAKLAFKEGDRKEAVACAAQALPFLHPRLTSTESKITVDGAIKEISDEKLDALLEAVEAEQERPLGSQLN